MVCTQSLTGLIYRFKCLSINLIRSEFFSFNPNLWFWAVTPPCMHSYTVTKRIKLFVLIACCMFLSDYTLCKDTNFNIGSSKDNGSIIFDPDSATKNPCIMEIQACGMCNVHLSVNIPHIEYCGTHPSVNNCGQG